MKAQCACGETFEVVSIHQEAVRKTLMWNCPLLKKQVAVSILDGNGAQAQKASFEETELKEKP